MSARRYLNEKTGAHPFDHRADASRPNVFLITVDMIPPESYAPESPMREHLRTAS